MQIVRKWTLLCAVVAVLSISSQAAITWFPKDFTCPIDGEKNTFLVVGSYGSYIYSYPSRFQFLFFPRTDSPTFHTCKKCSLSTFMWDFDKLPKDKLPAIKEAIKDVRVSKAFKEYTELPVVERLEIMQKVYAVMEKDDTFWEDFYRIKGYHYGKAGDNERAAEARRKSLELLQTKIKADRAEDSRKLLYYVSGAMRHFLNDDEGAVADFEKARATKYAAKDADAEELKNAEAGLNSRIDEYIELMKSDDKKPRFTDKDGGHGH